MCWLYLWSIRVVTCLSFYQGCPELFKIMNNRFVQGAAFNVTHFELAILLVWVVGGVADNGGWVLFGLGFSEQWNVGPCSSAYFVWNSLC
jgi:hypothetical protein